METIGLLSGIGHLPVDVALSAKSMGYRVIAVGVVPDIDPELVGYVQRGTDPNDRRRVLVSITEEGRDFRGEKKCRECGIALETTLGARRARCPGARAHPE